MHTHLSYPKWKYHPVKEATVIESHEEEMALGEGWVDSPADLKSVEPLKEIASEEAQAKKAARKAKA